MKLNFVVKILFICCLLLESCNYGKDCKLNDYLESINRYDQNGSIWPTLNSFVPVMEPKIGKHNYQKDYFIADFRQLELVSESFLPIVEKEIEEAELIKQKGKSYFGYENVDFRDEIENPIIHDLPLDSLIKIFELTDKQDLVFRSCQTSKVVNGFLFDKEYVRIVGYTDDNKIIKVLCINNFVNENLEFKNRLKYLMNKLNCVFVNYIDGRIYQSDEICKYESMY